MKDTVAEFQKELAGIDFSEAKQTVFSNTLGAPYPKSVGDMKQLLSQQLASPVRFVDELRAMRQAGASKFIEVGPSQILTGLLAKTLDESQIEVMACDQGSGNQVKGLAQVLLQAYVWGQSIDFSS